MPPPPPLQAGASSLSSLLDLSSATSPLSSRRSLVAASSSASAAKLATSPFGEVMSRRGTRGGTGRRNTRSSLPLGVGAVAMAALSSQSSSPFNLPPLPPAAARPDQATGGGALSARTYRHSMQPTRPTPRAPESARGSSHHSPLQGGGRRLSAAPSSASLFPSSSAHPFLLPAILASMLDPSLSSRALHAQPADHRAGSGYNPRAAMGLLHPLQAYAGKAQRHRISFKQRIVTQSPRKMEEAKQHSPTHASKHRPPLLDDSLSRDSGSPSAVIPTDADRTTLLDYLRSDTCRLWSGASAVLPTLTIADAQQLLRACEGRMALTLQSMRNLDAQGRRFTSPALLEKALQQVMQQRNLIFARVTGGRSIASPRATLASPRSVASPRASPHTFLTNSMLTALLDLSAVDRLLRECPRTSPASVLRLLDTLESQRVRVSSFNGLIAAVKTAEEREIAKQANSAAARNAKAVPRSALSAASPQRGLHSAAPSDAGLGNAASSAAAPHPGDFVWTEAPHIIIPSLASFVTFPTRKLFQPGNSALVAPSKSELNSLLSQASSASSSGKNPSPSAIVASANLSTGDQEMLLRLVLTHLEAAGFQCANISALNKEVARFIQAMHEACKPLHVDQTFQEIEAGLMDTPLVLTPQQRGLLYLHSTCGPYLHFHLRCLVSLGHRASSYADLVDALRAQHLQFMTQRAEEIRLVRSYVLSLHCFLFYEHQLNITRHECTQILEFNQGIKKIVSKAPITTVAVATEARSPTPAADGAAPVATVVPVVPSFPCLLGSENSSSVFMYLQALQQLGCKFESPAELVAAMRSLYLEQDALWSRASLVRDLLSQLAVPTSGVNDEALFALIYEPLHGGLQALVHMQLLVASGVHFSSVDEVAAALASAFLHSLEPPGLESDSFGTPENLFIYAFLKSPVACHMLHADVKAGLTLAHVHQLRVATLEAPAADDADAEADKGGAPLNPLQFLRVLYTMEEEAASAVESAGTLADHHDDDDEEPVHRVFLEFSDFATGVHEAADAFLGDKQALLAWLNDPAANQMFPKPEQEGVPVVSRASLDHFLDSHGATIPPASILDLARTLNAQGKRVASMTEFSQTVLALADAQSASKSLLFTYLASNTLRLLAKSCVIHDSDLAALIAAASSGAAALLALQRMEKELIIAHYKVQAQMNHHNITPEQLEQLTDMDALLGGMTMAQLIRAVRTFASDTEARWADVKHFLEHSRLVTEGFTIAQVHTNELMKRVKGGSVLADVQVHLVWLFAHTQRFTSYDYLLQALEAGAANGPLNLVVPVDQGAQFYLPSDAEMMLALHLFGPTCSLLKAGTLFAPGEFAKLLEAGGEVNLAFQHAIGLQSESVTCTSVPQLIEAVESRQSDMISRKQQVTSLINQKDCKLIATSSTGGDSATAERFQVTAANLNRLFSLTQTEADLFKVLADACVPPKPLVPVSALARHGPYRFFSHLIHACRGFFPHQHTMLGRKPGLAEDGRNSKDQEPWQTHPPMYRLATGTSSLIQDPMTEAPLALDGYEMQQLLAAAHSNVNACAMHLSLLEVMQRRFTGVHALLHAVQMAQKEQPLRMAELRSFVQQAVGYTLAKSELESLYYQSGAGPLCALFVQELVEADMKVTSVSGLVKSVRTLHERFVARRDAEMTLLRSFFRGSYEARQLFGKHVDELAPTVAPGLHVTDTELAQLLLAGGTGASVLIHVQHASLPGNEQLTSVAQLQQALTGEVPSAIKQSVLLMLRDNASGLIRPDPSTPLRGMTEADVDELLQLSSARTDVLVQLWALRAAGQSFASVPELAAAVFNGRIWCLETPRAQMAIVLAYLHSPTVNLLAATDKTRLGVAEVEKLVQLCGGGFPHTFSLLLALDDRSVQFTIADLAIELARMHESRQQQTPSRPVTAIARAEPEAEPSKPLNSAAAAVASILAASASASAPSPRPPAISTATRLAAPKA